MRRLKKERVTWLYLPDKDSLAEACQTNA